MTQNPVEEYDNDLYDDETSLCRMIAAVDTDDVDLRLQVTQGRDPRIVGVRNQLETEESNKCINDTMHLVYTEIRIVYPRAHAACRSLYIYYGRRRRIVSDHSHCFSSHECEEYLTKRNIEHVKVGTASPQANGQVQRVNRVIKAMLGKLIESINHADWSHRLLQVEFAINNSVHLSTVPPSTRHSYRMMALWRRMCQSPSEARKSDCDYATSESDADDEEEESDFREYDADDLPNAVNRDDQWSTRPNCEHEIVLLIHLDLRQILTTVSNVHAHVLSVLLSD